MGELICAVPAPLCPLLSVCRLRPAPARPFVPLQTTCGLFTFASDDNSTATYWGERWELYRHQYVLARWAWTMGVRRIEFWCDRRHPVPGPRPQQRSAPRCGSTLAMSRLVSKLITTPINRRGSLVIDGADRL